MRDGYLLVKGGSEGDATARIPGVFAAGDVADQSIARSLRPEPDAWRHWTRKNTSTTFLSLNGTLGGGPQSPLPSLLQAWTPC
jgi:hypothetical protein